MARKLKVYRTPIGFHDAYVAAPSQKAALKAWGSDANLFARGVAEEVTDEALTAEPLAHPGEVIRRARGTAAQHLAALPPTPAKKPQASKPTPVPAPPARPKKRTPRPSRDELDEAEAAEAEAQRRHDAAMRDLDDEVARIARERDDLTRTFEGERARLEKARRAAETTYRSALDAWEP